MNRELQWKLLDSYRRKLFLKHEIGFFFYKNITLNQYMPTSYRYLALYNRTKISRLASKTRLQNRCVITGRIWNVKKIYKYSRFYFRTEAYKGNLPGFQRASW